MTRNHAVSCLCACTTWLLAASAAAEPSAIALHWRAPLGCPSEADVRADVQHRLSADVLDSRLDVAISVEQLGENQWRAHVQMSGSLTAQRELDGDSCAALADASAWLVTAALGPAQPTAARRPGADPTQPERAALPSDIAADGGAPQRELALLAWLDAGSLPQLSAAFGLEFALRFTHWRFGVRPVFVLPRQTHLSQASARIGAAELPLQACYAWQFGDFALSPCASALLGLMWGSARGVTRARSRSGGLFGLEAGLTLTWPERGPRFFSAEAALARPLWAPRFTLGTTERVHRADSVIGRAGFSFGLRF